MTDEKSHHVFISYVRENQKDVDKLCDDLTKHGVSVWHDRKKIKPGIRWKNAIRKAIQSGNYFIACFSEEYNEREKTYMNEELTVAIDELRKISTDRAWFIPVLLSICDVSSRDIGGGETLSDIQWITLYEDWEKGIQTIIEAIKPIPLEEQKSAEVGKYKVLLVDDNPKNLQCLYQNMEDQGYILLLAENGIKALSIARNENPNLILLDVFIPDLDGFEVCRRLKADPVTREIPIIFSSSLAGIDDRVKGFELGAVDFIEKPFEPMELLQRVKVHIQSYSDR